MIQAIIKKGRVLPEDVPAPVVSDGAVLIKVANSCISAGTELTGVAGSGRSLIKRALEQPGNVKKVLNMVRTEGVAKAIARVKGVLDAGSPTGYSISGIVLATGKGVNDLQPGDKVAAAGAGIANHAEYVDVPRNLVMRIPEDLDFPEASTVTLGGIAMQGVRRADVALGEFVVVFGAGILGQLAIQMLNLSGARVIAVDLDETRLRIGREMGAEKTLNPNEEDVIQAVSYYTGGHGADVVLFCAATSNSQALSDAFAMTRKKGRLVMVGVWGDKLNRDDMYKKELDFLISTSYGPGRYDTVYEEQGLDYPYAYVRWTENRNMEEFLRLLSKGYVQVKPLIDATYPISQVEEAFQSLQGQKPPLMVLLDYGREFPHPYASLTEPSRRIQIRTDHGSAYPNKAEKIRVGLIGAGGFATGMHLPNLSKLPNDYSLQSVCTRTGSKANDVAKQFGAAYATTDYKEILEDPDVDLTMICTRHNLHARMVLDSLKAGKHTFVEKPLCTTREELEEIKQYFGFGENNVDGQGHALSAAGQSPVLMVGFNRRFSRYAREIKRHTENRINPLFLHYRMNAGYFPPDHWVHSEEGGGRIVGEACHIIDLFSYLVGAPVVRYSGSAMQPSNESLFGSDNKSITLEYKDGSVGTIHYFAVGSKDLPKERLEVHFDGKSIVLDDYKILTGYGIAVKKIQSAAPEKGQIDEMKTLSEALSKGNVHWPIDLYSLLETTEITLEIK